MSTHTSPIRSTELKNPLVWIDLEMTGLDQAKDTIIEIACILTDGQLSREIEGPNTAINHPDQVFEEMGPWCQNQHNKSGLVQRCKQSRYNLQQAEQLVLDFVKEHISLGIGLLAGSSIHCDKAFLRKDMPVLHDYLHYRIVDVSSVKELCRRWYPEEFKNAPKKSDKHVTLIDIRESIMELRYYRTTIFKM
eukprot:g5072.t1